MNFADLETQRADAARELLKSLGIAGTATPLPGGANNRVYRVTDSTCPVLLKAYFRHPADSRDRLGTEFAFSNFAWQRGIRNLPQPLAKDNQYALGIYEFIPGSQPSKATDKNVSQALAFFQALNQYKTHPDAEQLPNGSEASFSIAAHLGMVGRRVQRLLDAKIVPEAANLVQEKLLPTWQHILMGIYRSNLNLDEELPQEHRCISPSDFGFHNAIQRDDGSLVFIDFEYAGWDDPAKLVGDFFSQPQVPIPMEYYDQVVEAVAPALRPRIDLLLPVYRLKWCCILLNDFLPTSQARRAYANKTGGEAVQLEKARHALERIELE